MPLTDLPLPAKKVALATATRPAALSLPPARTQMLHFILSAALAPLLVSADARLEDGVQLVFRGSVEPRTDEAGNSGKSFDLSLWVLEKNDTSEIGRAHV